MGASCAFEDALSRVTFIDYCCAVEGLVQRRLGLICVLEQSVSQSSHASTIARCAVSAGSTRSQRPACAPRSASFERFAKPSLLSGFLGIVSKRVRLCHEARPGPDHEGWPATRAQTACRGGARLPPRARDRRGHRSPPRQPEPARRAGRLARAAAPARTLDTSRSTPRQTHRHRRDRLRTRARRILLRNRRTRLTTIPHTHPRRRLPGRARAPRSPPRRHPRAREHRQWATQPSDELAEPRPILEYEPGDEQGS